MKRRDFFKPLAGGATLLATQPLAWAKTYLTPEQAKLVLWDTQDMVEADVELTREQITAIRKACGVRVRNALIRAWRTRAGDWFILDQVIGKHENIDLAVGLTRDGKVKGLEILEYRETYGHQIRNPEWRAQFHGKSAEDNIRLGRNIKNISGATLSCRHVSDGIKRLCSTWELVLKQQPMPR